MEPRKEQNDILENDMQLRGGPKQLNQLSTNMVFESEEYLVLNKQYDTRLDGQFACTIEKALRRDFPSVDKFRWIHQLDFGIDSYHEVESVNSIRVATSGIMCIGRTKAAARVACKLFEFRQVEKEYTAMVHGHVPFKEKLVTASIAEVPDSFKMQIGTEDRPGKIAKTMIHVENHGTFMNMPVTIVKLLPLQGRRHQLRLHLLHIGHPIVGDATYGEEDQAYRMMLHARRLKLCFQDRQEMEFVADATFVADVK